MFKPLQARPARDPDEERKIRKLAGARHAPADWVLRARMITGSWAGTHLNAIATELRENFGFRPAPSSPREDGSVFMYLKTSAIVDYMAEIESDSTSQQAI